MIIPSAMDLYAAAESLKKERLRLANLFSLQIAELDAAFPTLQQEYGVALPARFAHNDFASGYEFGLQVARIIIRRDIILKKLNINADGVL